MASGENISYMLSVVPGTMTGFASLNAGLSSINNAFLQITGAIDNSVGLWNSMMITAGVVAAQVATDAMDAFGQFEQGMKIAQMVSGQTADQISYLGQKANEFSVQYRMDIDQITEGLQTLGRAGLNTASEQAEVLQNGLNTAKLEGRELNSVLQELIQNTALLGGDLKSDQFGEQSQYVNDLLVATSMTAPITTHDISETLKYSGGIAAAAGANIESEQGKKILEDYMGAIASFAQKGVTGSIAGTALRAFFNKPATQDSSVVDALSSLGLKAEDLWERGGETMKPVSEQIEIIKTKMDELNVSTMDQLQIWSKIVGGKMGQQMMKLDSENIKEITKDIQAADNAQSLATRSMQTYEANLKQIGESGQVFFRNIGRFLVEYVNPFLEIIKPIADFLSQDFMALPIAAGTISFIGYVIKKIREVGAILRKEIGAFRNLYKTGGTTTFAAWRENVLGSKQGGGSKTKDSSDKKSSSTTTATSSQEAIKKPTSLSALAKSIKESTTKGVWREYQRGLLSKDQAAGIYNTSSWTKENVHGFGVSDAKIMNELIRKNALSQEALDDINRHGMGKKAWMSKWQTRYEELALNTKVLEDAIRQAAQAEQEDATATERLIAAGEAHASKVQGFFAEEAEAAQVAAAKVSFSFQEMWANMLATVRSGLLGTPNAKNMGAAFKFYSQKAEEERAANKVFEEERKQEYARQKKEANKRNKERNRRINQANRVYRAAETQRYFEATQKHLNGEYNKPKQLSLKEKWEKAQRQTLINRGGGIQEIDDATAKHMNRLVNQHKQNLVDQARQDYANKEAKALESAQKRENEKINHRKNLVENSRKANDALVARQQRIEQERAEQQERVRQQEERVRQQQVQQEKEAKLRQPKTYGSGSDAWSKSSGLVKGANAYQQEEESKATKGLSNIAKERAKTEKAINNIAKKATTFEERMRTFSTQRLSAEEKIKRLSALRADDEQKTSSYAKANQKNSVAAVNERIASGKTSLVSGPNGYMIPISQGTTAQKAKASVSDTVKGVRNTITGTYTNAKDAIMKTLTADRSGKVFNAAGGGKLAKTFNGLANVGGSLTSLMGGPLMAAMLAFSIITTIISNEMEKYNQRVKEASQKLDDAYSALESADDKLRETFAEGNPNASDEDIDQMVLDTYSKMYETMNNASKEGMDKWVKATSSAANKIKEYEYDVEKNDGSMKELASSQKTYAEKVDENTAALYAAASEVSQAMSKYVQETSDSAWGTDGWSTAFSDLMGNVSTHFANMGPNYEQKNEFLLTASQQDDNYAGNKEMVGLMLEDFKDAASQTSIYVDNGSWGNGIGRDQHNVIVGLYTLMGTADEVLEYWQILGEDGRKFLTDEANFAAQIGSANNMRLQQSMQRDKSTWQSLAKEIAKQENKNKRSLGAKDTNKKLEGLIAKLQATMGAGFTRTQILQAAYLQMMQDMYSIAQSVMLPLISQNAQNVAQTMLTSQGIQQSTSGTGVSTYNTAAIAQTIAGYVAIMAKQSAKDAFYDYAMDIDPEKASAEDKRLHELAMSSKDSQEFYKKAKELGEGSGWWNGWQKDTSAMEKYLEIYGATAYQTIYGMDSATALDKATQYVEGAVQSGSSVQSILSTLEKNYQSTAFTDALIGAYLASDIGEAKESSSDSSSSDTDSDKTKTRKERVDLVLCSKKEIPKLNVNLFKKAPSFTILNKNFKLRDIKVNTEDKPKAILSSIKNAIIDVQKRSDPKIIQDESAEYDPVAATDGSSVPFGSTNTSTDV